MNVSRDPQLTALTSVRRHPQPPVLYEELRRVDQIEIDLRPVLEAFCTKSVAVESQPNSTVSRMFAAGIILGLIGFGLAIGTERMISKYLPASPTAAVLLPQTPDHLIQTQSDLRTYLKEEDGGPPQEQQVSPGSYSSTSAAVMELQPVYDEGVELSVPPDETGSHGSNAPSEASETASAAGLASFRSITVDGQTYEISIPPRISSPDHESSNPEFDTPEIDLHMLRMPRQLVISNPAVERAYHGLTPQDILRQLAARNR